jgi:hypothetical protein
MLQQYSNYLKLRNYRSFHGLFLRQYMYNVIRRATSTHLAIYYAIVTKVNALKYS